MENFFVFDLDLPAGVGIRWLGKEHILWLVSAAVVTLLLCIACARASERGRRRIRCAVCVLILLCEANRQLCLLSAGVWGVYTLPLHLCSMSVFVVLWNCLRGSKLSGELLYCLTMPGAAFALVFPDWLDYPALNLLSIGTFLGHILLIAYPAMSTACGLIRPEARRLPRCFACLFAAAVVMYVFNKCTGANYFFLNSPAPGSPLEWFARFLGNPGYILGFLPILSAVWLILYLPWMRKRRKRKAPDKAEPL